MNQHRNTFLLITVSFFSGLAFTLIGVLIYVLKFKDDYSLKNYCFKNTKEIAAIVGGEPEYWTAPEFKDGAWIFDAGSQNWITLTIPDWGGQIDYWGGEAVGSDSITNGSVVVDSASFHCK